jgi:hypothetical protein
MEEFHAKDLIKSQRHQLPGENFAYGAQDWVRRITSSKTPYVAWLKSCLGWRVRRPAVFDFAFGLVFVASV